MRVDLHAATDVAQYVLFDPAAVPEWIRHDLPFPSGLDWLQAPAEQGNLLDYRDDSDGDRQLRLYIDEPVEPRLLQIAQPTLSGAMLNVPSGNLWFLGAECLKADRPERSSPATYQPGRMIMGEQTTVPPGRYRVDVWETDPEICEERSRAELSPETQRLVDRFNNVMAIGCLLSLLLLVGAAILAVEIGFDTGNWLQVAQLTGLGLTPVLIYWLLAWRVIHSPRYDEALQAQEAACRNWPSLLLHLQTIHAGETFEDPTPGVLRPYDFISETQGAQPVGFD